MKYFVFIAVLVTVALAIPLDIAEDEDGQQYYLVPVSREKRQTQWGISDSGASLGHKGTILDNDRHILDGSGYAGKNFHSHGLSPDQAGGRLDYAHKPTGSTAFLSADHARGYGTDVAAGLKYNVYQNKNFEAGVNGGYSRHYGGPSGTGKADPFIGIGVQGRF